MNKWVSGRVMGDGRMGWMLAGQVGGRVCE